MMGMSSSTPVAEVIASAPVVVFAASWCPYCKQAKAALKEAGIEFKDVEVTDAQKAELKALTCVEIKLSRRVSATAKS